MGKKDPTERKDELMLRASNELAPAEELFVFELDERLEFGIAVFDFGVDPVKDPNQMACNSSNCTTNIQC